MRNSCFLVALTAGFILLLSSCSSGPCPEDEAAVRASIAGFYEAIEEGDTEARIDLLAEDVILMPNHWTILRGKDAVASSFRSGADAVFRIRDRDELSFEISGCLAYTVNGYDYTYHAADASEQWHQTKNVHIWRRSEDGRWRLAVDIWNSDVPIENFASE